MSGITNSRESSPRAHETLREGWKGMNHKTLPRNGGVHEPPGNTEPITDRSCIWCASLNQLSFPEAATQILGQHILLSFHNIVYLE